MQERFLFRKHLAPTSPEPVELMISKAQGVMLYDENEKPYFDLIGGISVGNVGHCHPAVVAAVKAQAERYMHVMVYGELVQSPQVEYAALLARHLPEGLDSVYFTNSGAEAVEGALKLAKRLTGRTNVLACEKSYHGSTQGALSLMGDEYWRNAYRPLLPGIRHIRYNEPDDLVHITEQTACFVLEPIQAEAGIRLPDRAWMQAVRQRCDATGTLLILDEIQTGFGRTGTLWGFQQFDIQPDILLLGKALGGGMPLGAFIASAGMMRAFTHNPVLGHMTTFGGHPVCCAAGKAAMEVLLEEQLAESAREKGQYLLDRLALSKVRAVRGTGLMLALELDSAEQVREFIRQGLNLQPEGIFTDWFLFADNCLRIVPPLTVSAAELDQMAELINQLLENLK